MIDYLVLISASRSDSLFFFKFLTASKDLKLFYIIICTYFNFSIYSFFSEEYFALSFLSFSSSISLVFLDFSRLAIRSFKSCNYFTC